MKLIRDTWLIFERMLFLALRNPVWIAVGLIQPILYLVLFGPLLNSIAEHTPGFPPGGAFNVFVPGLLIQLALFGTSFVGFALISEVRSGVIVRMSSPHQPFAMLFGGRAPGHLVLDVGASY